MAEFDYESKIWGAHKVAVSPTFLGALRLQYCLKDLRAVRGKVLEVGCGAGGMAEAIKAYRPDLEVYGIDISRRSISGARATPGGVIFEIGDAYDLPYSDGSFAAVVIFDVLEHLQDPGRAIAEAWRVLGKRGMFHVFVPCEGGRMTLHGLLSRIGWTAKERYGGHIQRLTRGNVISMLEVQGFRVRSTVWSCHFVNQVVDVSYFTALSIRGRNSRMSVEGYLESVEAGIVPTVVRVAKAAVAVASYYESRLFSYIPGAGAHISSDKDPSTSGSRKLLLQPLSTVDLTKFAQSEIPQRAGSQSSANSQLLIARGNSAD